MRPTSDANGRSLGIDPTGRIVRTRELASVLERASASRYRAFQWTETAIYVALALALTGYCFWRIRRRLS